MHKKDQRTTTPLYSVHKAGDIADMTYSHLLGSATLLILYSAPHSTFTVKDLCGPFQHC